MDLLKKTLLLIVIVELVAVITIFTKYSLKRIDKINSDYALFTKREGNSTSKNSEIIQTVMASFDYNRYQTSRDKILNSITEDIESRAKQFLGKKYVWGGTGPNCFDCSGFTQKVYKAVGINIPRVSKNQAKVGKLVRFNELQKGDMVFFDTSRKYRGKVNHVGIYLENGKFIHASSGKHKVVITSFDKKRFYKSRFLWGRRVIKGTSPNI